MAAIQPGQTIPLNPPSGASGRNVSGAHAAILAVLIEMSGLAIVIMIAGTDDQIANLVLIFMFGVLLLFLVMHPSQVSSLGSFLTKKEQAAAG